jgi:hypothetical protein
MPNFTLEVLIAYYYQETTHDQTKVIEDLLLSDPVLKKTYSELVETITSLPPETLSPTEQSINRIKLRASKLLQELHTH